MNQSLQEQKAKLLAKLTNLDERHFNLYIKSGGYSLPGKSKNKNLVEMGYIVSCKERRKVYAELEAICEQLGESIPYWL